MRGIGVLAERSPVNAISCSEYALREHDKLGFNIEFSLQGKAIALRRHTSTPDASQIY